MSSTATAQVPPSPEHAILAAVQKRNKQLATITPVIIDLAKIPEQIMKDMLRELQNGYKSNISKASRFKRSLSGQRIVVGTIHLDTRSPLPVGTVPLPPFTGDILLSNALDDPAVIKGFSMETFVALYGDLLFTVGETKPTKMLVLSTTPDRAGSMAAKAFKGLAKAVTVIAIVLSHVPLG